MRRMRKLASAAALTVAAMAPSIVLAQQPSDQWQFRAALYGWFPDIGGKTTFPAGTGSNIDVTSDTIINNLKFTFMGTLEAQKGRWGAFTDIVYLDVGGSKSGTRDLRPGGGDLPAGITADANLDIKGTVWTLAGSYRVATDPAATLDVLAGARMIQIKENLGWQFSTDIVGISPPPRTGSSEQKITNWDAIVGVKGRVAFGNNREWFVPYYLDVGTGESDFTWQAIGGLGYAFRWGEIFAVWRYLDYDFGSNKGIQEVNLNGPAIGVAFRW